ncbi:hypothetical protein HXA34_08820 [Salipaludibacillus agaradhaerens]|nr:hypothetical protein [Salipaludibacillus agaradhaerens]MCR6106381.1 hypothetical protein [Salipaludibacillus agaradhaerens]MCR6118414.1 hypothetical protein [Salipaludibacillus agaradhaerens]
MRIMVYLCMLFLLTACVGDVDQGQRKDTESVPVQDSLAVKAIEVANPVNPEVVGWFDSDHILYNVSEGNGKSSLFRHHLYNGESTLFASFNGIIEAVYPNENYSLFAVKVSESYAEKTLFIVDEHGTETLSKSIEGVDFSFSWNPYEDTTAALGILDETFNTQLYMIHLGGEEWETVMDFPYYSQWVGKEKLAYLNWQDNPYGFKAPLNEWHVASPFSSLDSDQRLHDEVIMFYGLSSDYYLTVSTEEESRLISRFQLHDLNTKEPLEEWESPSFMTESGDWWVPELSYQNNVLYYYEPISDNSRFSLVMLEIKSMEKQELDTFSESSSIEISPDGQFILTGEKLDILLNVETDESDFLIP